jgi:hypothetical protein
MQPTMTSPVLITSGRFRIVGGPADLIVLHVPPHIFQLRCVLISQAVRWCAISLIAYAAAPRRRANAPSRSEKQRARKLMEH